MGGIILPVLFVLIIFFDFGKRKGRGRVVYICLAAISVALAVGAGMAARDDHIGASLSGMISIFMR